MRLYRSVRDKKIMGVCAGLAEYFNVDVTLLRLIVVITAFFSGGAVIFIYLVAGLVIPKEPGHGQDYYYRPHNDDPYRYNQGNANNYNQGHNNWSDWTQSRATHAAPPPPPPPASTSAKPDLDEMMDSLEKKAMMNEIRELRAKLDKYEKGE